MRGTKLLLIVGLTALLAGVPIAAAFGADGGPSILGVSISLGPSGAAISTDTGDKKSKPGTDEKGTDPQMSTGGDGQDGKKGDDRKQQGGKPSRDRVPSNADARPIRLPARARPVFGRSLGAVPVSGLVLVRLPGAASYVALSNASRVPNGSLVDSSAGVVQLTSARDASGRTQTAAFSGTTFVVGQPCSSSGVTDLVLRGAGLGRCVRSGGRAFATAARSGQRRLWGNGHGRFRTRGRYGAATVRGTVWLTEDRCDGTLVRVRRGRVSVRDFARHRSSLVAAGHSRLVRAPR